MARVTYYIEYDGGGKYAWEAEEDKYKDIAATLGIKKASNTTKSLFFGANKPKPPRIRLNFEDGGVGGNVCRGSQLVFCAPGKIDEATAQGKLTGKKSNGFKIKSAGLPRS